ncbi:MAG TPA: glycosyltransferase family 2 protein, partial [Candidatus Hydrogenedentes bacterium]|nr:glycosyltransferase family 2 protein [Candidatus Hydrogenedentota bacterium]
MRQGARAILDYVMNMPLVHCFVINWNGLEHLEACFEALLAGTYENARFVLIDNASEDGSAEFVQGTYGYDPRLDIVVNASNLGWSAGNNVGLEQALDGGADYVFLLNNDTVVAPDAIERLVEMAAARPEAGALAPKMLLYDSPDIINSVGLECSVIGSTWDLGIGRLDGPHWATPRKVIGVCGGACFLRTSALRKTGLLPTGFGIYLDDLDLCLRLWDAGYEVWNCPDAVVRHKYSATM